MAEQIGLAGFDDTDESEYSAFVEKFKPKKTTDDCYTPDNVYEAVAEYCVKRYGISREKMLRPFWPGGDYENAEYPAGCVVVDNPPFSILSAIIDFFNWKKIPFFLFAPYLTNFNYGNKVTHVITEAKITYKNGAVVNTAFVTSLEPEILARADPELTAALRAAEAENTKPEKELPKYKYPANLLTATMLGGMAKRGIRFEVRKDAGMFIRALDEQKKIGKTVFGGGFLISSAAAADTRGIEIGLSDREKEIVKWLDERSGGK